MIPLHFLSQISGILMKQYHFQMGPNGDLAFPDQEIKILSVSCIFSIIFRQVLIFFCISSNFHVAIKSELLFLAIFPYIQALSSGHVCRAVSTNRPFQQLNSKFRFNAGHFLKIYLINNL